MFVQFFLIFTGFFLSYIYANLFTNTNVFVGSHDEVAATKMLLGKANLTGYQVIILKFRTNPPKKSYN